MAGRYYLWEEHLQYLHFTMEVILDDSDLGQNRITVNGFSQCPF